MESNKANLLLEFLRTDSVKYIIIALIIIGLYLFFKRQFRGKIVYAPEVSSGNIDEIR